VSELQRNLAESIMRAVGITYWVKEEKQMDAITAISGSGPAYFFYFMEAMHKSAVSLGLDEECARLFTLQTALGAAKLAFENSDDCQTLRERVTSPGGTTEQAIKSFEENNLHDLVDKAVHSAYNKSIELGDILGKNL
jgi:pyrroline-5-carboxylate reductase